MAVEREIESIETSLKPAIAEVIAAFEANDVEAMADATASLVEASVELAELVAETAVEEGVLEPEEAEMLTEIDELEMAEEE